MIKHNAAIAIQCLVEDMDMYLDGSCIPDDDCFNCSRDNAILVRETLAAVRELGDAIEEGDPNVIAELWLKLKSQVERPEESRPEPDQPSPMNVRVFLGAEHAYACIKTPQRSMDVLLHAGRSAQQSLRESALGLRSKSKETIARAKFMEQAADRLDIEKSKPFQANPSLRNKMR